MSLGKSTCTLTSRSVSRVHGASNPSSFKGNPRKTKYCPGTVSRRSGNNINQLGSVMYSHPCIIDFTLTPAPACFRDKSQLRRHVFLNGVSFSLYQLRFNAVIFLNLNEWENVFFTVWSVFKFSGSDHRPARPESEREILCDHLPEINLILAPSICICRIISAVLTNDGECSEPVNPQK